MMAVADGVSNSLHSEAGAQAAINALKEFWESFASPYEGVEEIQAALATSFNYALANTGIDPDSAQYIPGSLETTLSAILISPGLHLYGMYVGDGGVWLTGPNRESKCLTKSMRDEEGCVVPLSYGPKAWHFFDEQLFPDTGILMMTDGVHDLALNDRERILPKLIRAIVLPPDKLERSLDSVLNGTDDDITVSYLTFRTHPQTYSQAETSEVVVRPWDQEEQEKITINVKEHGKQKLTRKTVFIAAGCAALALIILGILVFKPYLSGTNGAEELNPAADTEINSDLNVETEPETGLL